MQHRVRLVSTCRNGFRDATLQHCRSRSTRQSPLPLVFCRNDTLFLAPYPGIYSPPADRDRIQPQCLILVLEMMQKMMLIRVIMCTR
ncbi:hypothetical protein BJX62DRAFT_211420 [Aspergillus germanicus]